MNNEFSEEAKDTTESGESEQKYAFKNVLKKNPNKRTWSVLSIVLAALSIVFSIPFPVAGLILALLAIGSAIFSRLNLTYFDKLSLAGLIVGIFGVVFSVVGLFVSPILMNFITAALLS